ncbi:MAG: antibiotic biosynthesis monooxygenase [Oculatellaceae cyanobacterium bins.114]|nr:antibiotic biosynthesis monooxygenase [Oculatellaceae cyanobacterium bins.114]
MTKRSPMLNQRFKQRSPIGSITREKVSVLEESLIVDTNEDNHQVTAVISHIVRPGREQGYEEWFHGIAADARKFKGHLGVSAIRPHDHAHPEYVVILKFDHYNHLKQWMKSDVRREWLERLQPLIEKPETVQTLTGLETWFTVSDKPLKSPPPRYKMFMVTWLGVFITLAILSRLLAPLLTKLPLLLSQLVITGLVVLCLTYWIMPRLTKLFQRWLYPKL